MRWFARKRRSTSGIPQEASYARRISPGPVEQQQQQHQQQQQRQRQQRSSRPATPRTLPPTHSRAHQKRPATPSAGGMKTVDVDVVLSKEKELLNHHRRRTSSPAELPPRAPALRRSSREDITALPGSRELNTSPHLRPATQDNADILYLFHLNSSSHASMPSPRHPSGKLQRQSSKRAAQDGPLPKRKSTKRRKDDHVREEEIRAMSACDNGKRPSYRSSMLRRNSKRTRNGMNKRFQRHDSNVSLPRADNSLHSSSSTSTADPNSYHLSKLDVFAPRPHIRASINYYAQGLIGAQQWASRTDSRQNESQPPQRRKLTPTKEVLKQRKRVDELADGLDSSDIRAALERDSRRKEAKKQKEVERARRKLARKAEKQRAGEVDESPTKRKRKDPDKHVGLGIDSPVDESPKRKKKDFDQHPDSNFAKQLHTASSDEEIIKKETYLGYTRALQADWPSSSPDRSERRPVQPRTEADLAGVHPSERPQGSAFSLADEPASLTVQTTPKKHSPLPNDASSIQRDSPETIEALPQLPQIPQIPPSPTRAEPVSRSGSRRSARGIIGFFRRGPSIRNRGTENGHTITPSDRSFSNTSRESMARAHLAANITTAMSAPSSQQAQHPPSTQVRASRLPQRDGSNSTTTTASRQVRDRSGTPVRTMSKFREDLPELPLSPPDSRLASPNPEYAGALAARRGIFPYGGNAMNADPALPLSSDAGSASGSGAASINNDDRAVRSANLMSTSLASVDSEASWLSGKPSKKASLRRSGTSGSGFEDDDYVRRLAPSPEHERESDIVGRKASSTILGNTTPRGAADVEDEGEATENEDDLRRTSLQKVNEKAVKTGDVGKTPRLVQSGRVVKSREGLLNDFESQHRSSQAATVSVTPDASPERRFRSEDVETPEPYSPTSEGGTDIEAHFTPAEPVTLARASSIKMKEATNPRLLDIPARRGSGVPSPNPSEGPTAWRNSRDSTPAQERKSFDTTPPRKEGSMEPPGTAKTDASREDSVAFL